MAFLCLQRPHSSRSTLVVSPPGSLAKRRFTLVEMLVVIAIIGILASLLMPSLMKSIATARALQCTSNWRQIGTATTQYLNDNGQRFFETVGFSAPSESNHTCKYNWYLRHYYGGTAPYSWTTSHVEIDYPLEKCPEDIRSAEIGRGGFSFRSGLEPNPRMKVSFYRSPSRAPIFWDNDFYYNSAYGYDFWWCQMLEYSRHSGKINFWCLDGHVETRSDITSAMLFRIHSNGEILF